MLKKQENIPNIAVLMTTYNGERYLGEQIDSVLAQQKVNIHLYIRDDGSSDDTVSIINSYRHGNSKVFLLDSPPVPAKVTKNFFSIVRDIDLADIDYMAYCDQDDIWLSNKLSVAVREITERNVSCYASNLLMGNGKAELVKKTGIFSKLAGYVLNFKTNKQLRYDHYFEAASAGCTLVLNKAAAVYLQQRIRVLFDRIPSDASHDWSTYAITRLHSFNWYIDKNAYIIYRQHADNAYGANMGTAGIAKLIALFNSGWYRGHILLIADLYNEENSQPAFISMIRTYKQSSLISRLRVAFAVCRYRRKFIHRIALFALIVFGYFK